MTSLSTRITNPGSADLAAAGTKLGAGEKLTLQFDEACYARADLQVIDSLCAQHGNSLEVRFYGHYGSVFDGKTLTAIPHVANLSIDCLQQASNLDALAELGNLDRLSLGVFELADPHVLRFPSLQGVRSLSLGEARSKNLELSYLADYRELEALHISGHTKGVADVANVSTLTSLGLWCIPKRTSLDFISSLCRLKQLKLGLGGRESIAEIDAPSLQELEVLRVRGLSDLSRLGRFPNLASLTVEDQIQLHQLEFTSENAQLRKLRIFNCKSLRELSGLEYLGRLHELRVGMTAIDPDALVAASMPPSLEVCAFYTGKERENRRLRTVLDARGYVEFQQSA